jgi:hypothetical protein
MILDERPTLEEIAKQENRPPIVVAYGGGTDSTAMILACHSRGIPIDLIIFSDTGGEKPHTYKYLDTMDEWLTAHGYDKIARVAPYLALYEHCIRYKALPSIAFGRKQCSVRSKVRPQHRYIRKWPKAKATWKAKGKVIQLIGYDANETRRAKIKEDEKFLYYFPLIEFQMDRNTCMELIKANGLPLPGKSSCYFCPMTKKADIIDLAKRYPDLAEKALFMEENAKEKFPKGLGRGYSWKDIIEEDERASKLAKLWDEEMPCGCFDGD